MAASPDQIVFFDGGASPNPGPMLVAVVHRVRTRLYHVARIEGGNNEAEFRAAMAALSYALTNGIYQPLPAGATQGAGKAH